jgi:hypothetical protein
MEERQHQRHYSHEHERWKETQTEGSGDANAKSARGVHRDSSRPLPLLAGQQREKGRDGSPGGVHTSENRAKWLKIGRVDQRPRFRRIRADRHRTRNLSQVVAQRSLHSGADGVQCAFL